MELPALINNSDDIVGQLVTEVGHLALWLQAIGLLVVFWLIFQIISLVNDKKKRKRLERIEERLDRINKKLDGIILINKKK